MSLEYFMFVGDPAFEDEGEQIDDEYPRCECVHNQDCHIPRQLNQQHIRAKDGSAVEECTFYRMFEEIGKKVSE